MEVFKYLVANGDIEEKICVGEGKKYILCDHLGFFFSPSEPMIGGPVLEDVYSEKC